MSSVITGRYGKFQVGTTIVARISSWSVNPKLASSSTWGDSDTAGYTARMGGRKDCSFSCEGKFDKDEEQYDLFQPGDKVTATLWMTITPALYWHFPSAMCEDFSMQINTDSQEVVGWSSSWGADGKFYRPNQAGIPVVTYPSDSDSQ